MKAQVKIKSLSRGESGDSIKFIDDATGQLPPTVTLQGGEKDGEKFTPKALRFGKEAGRLVVTSNGKELLNALGEFQRTDAWELDEETGEIEASASLTFTMSRRVHPEEIAGLFGADSLSIRFTPSQKSLEFKKATGHEPADFVKQVGKELETHFGPGEMVDGTLTFNAKAKGKKKDAA